jgi:hypothetical protein
MRSPSLLAVLCVCVSAAVHAAEAPEDDAARWRIGRTHTKGKPGNPWVERNRRDPRFVFVAPDTPPSQLLEVLLANPRKSVMSADGMGSMTSYSLQDLKWAPEIRDWRENGCRKYLIEPPIGGYVKSTEFNGTLVVEGGTTQLPFGATRSAHHELRKPGRGKCRVFVYIGAPTTAGDGFYHEFFRSHVRDGPQIAKRHGSLVVESEHRQDEFRTTDWVSDGLVISVFGQVDIEEVVQAYLKKYPSSVPIDLEFDVAAWGRRELKLRLAEMRERLELPDRSLVYRPPPGFGQALTKLTHTFDIAELKGEHGRERKRLHKELIAGDEWRQDYEAYRQALRALRSETLGSIEALFDGKEIRFSRRKGKFVPAGSAGSGSTTNAVLIGGVFAAIGGTAIATYVLSRKHGGSEG